MRRGDLGMRRGDLGIREWIRERALEEPSIWTTRE